MVPMRHLLQRRNFFGGDNMFKYHSHLPKKLWQKNKINPLARQALLMIGHEYVRYLAQQIKLPINTIDITDVFIHGSTTNYYWDRFSDIDLCIVAKLGPMHAKLNGLNIFALNKSLLKTWKSTFHISIFGRSIDITLVDVNDGYDTTHKKVGSCYSLTKDCWINPPIKLNHEKVCQIQRDAYKKYRVIMRQCRYIIRHKMSPDFIDAYLVELQHARIKNMASNYVQPITSYCMAFKLVRNTGYLRKLRRISKKMRSRCFILK